MDLDVGTVDRLLTTTRAVRKRLDLTRPVPAAVITECVGMATQAPTDARIASLLPVAYYTGDTFQPAKRRPVEDVLSWDGWNAGAGNVRARD
jgi:hypothetical protein